MAPWRYPQSAFELASVTKPFTALLLAAFAVQQRIALDDPQGHHRRTCVRVATVTAGRLYAACKQHRPPGETSLGPPPRPVRSAKPGALRP